MLRRFAPRGIVFRFHQPLDPILEARSVGVHLFLVERADIIDVDIDREAIQIGVEDIERRPTLQRDARRDQCVGAERIKDIDQPDHPLQCGGLKLPLGRKVL